MSLFYFSDLLQPLLLCRERWFGKRKAEDSLIKGFINSHFAIPSVKRIFLTDHLNSLEFIKAEKKYMLFLSFLYKTALNKLQV